MSLTFSMDSRPKRNPEPLGTVLTMGKRWFPLCLVLLTAPSSRTRKGKANSSIPKESAENEAIRLS